MTQELKKILVLINKSRDKAEDRMMYSVAEILDQSAELIDIAINELDEEEDQDEEYG